MIGTIGYRKGVDRDICEEADLFEDFMRKGLNYDLKERWTAAQLLLHDWMKYEDSETV